MYLELFWAVSMTTPKIAWSSQKSVFTHPKEHNHTTHGLQNFVVVVQSLTHIQLFVTHGLQHTRHPCPSLSSWAHTHVHWVSDAIHPSHPPSVLPFSSCLQSFPASGAFPISRLFTSGGQSIGASASASVPGLISFRTDRSDLLAVQGTLQSLLQHHSSKASIL